jgi:chitinase
MRCLVRWFTARAARLRGTSVGLLAFLLVVAACQVPLDELRQRDADANANARVTSNTPIVLGYFPSWSETYPQNGTTRLTSIPTHVTHLFFSFAKPNLRYQKGSFNLAQTGIEVPYDGQTLRSVLTTMRQRGTKVILSIGGETYWATADAYNIDYQQIKDLVDDMGFAGIDWDFEPNGSFQDIGSAQNVARFIQFINSSRQLMPRSAGYLIACAPSGAGALGGLYNDIPTSKYAYAKRNQLTGEPDTYLYSFSDSQRSISLFGFSSTGHMLPVFQAAGSNLDIVAFQGYNTGAAPNRTLMYDSYAYYANQYGFRVAAGTHVPNEPWGPYYTYSAQKTASLAEYIRNGGAEGRAGAGDGIMIWQVLAQTALAADANYTGITYLNVASKVLNGATPTAAIAAAFDYLGQPPVPGVPAAPTVSATLVTVNTAITGTSVAGTLQVLKDGTQLTTQTVTGTSWSYTPTTTGSYTFRIQTSGGTSAASVAVTVYTPTTPPTGGCNIPAYDPAKTYPTPGTRVLYNSKVYENKWYINPGEAPNPSNPWDAWKFIQNCGN